MSAKQSQRLHLVLVFGGLLLPVAGLFLVRGVYTRAEIIHVYPGGDIQAALEVLASRPGKGTVRVHAGTYRPAAPGQALLFFNARHDGISVEADGAVILTAANPAIADPKSPSYPAVVNHVVYFGDGISRATQFRGFKVTGANGFVSGPTDLMTIRTESDLMKSIDYRTRAPSPIESNSRLDKTHYFFVDGGGILIYGRSYPTIEGVDVYKNHSSLCGGGVSIQHRSPELTGSVLFKHCVFRDNTAAVSGSGADLMPGSCASFDDCLFVGNLSNTEIDSEDQYPHGALTIFPGCRATVSECTFTGNRNGVCDLGTGSTYRNTVFWRNDREGGAARRSHFELVVNASAKVTGCLISGLPGDTHANISPSDNMLDAPDPSFDTLYRSQNRGYAGLGWRKRSSESEG